MNFKSLMHMRGSVGRGLVPPILMIMRLGVTSAWVLPSILVPGQRIAWQAWSPRIPLQGSRAARMTEGGKQGVAGRSASVPPDVDVAVDALEHRAVSLVNKIPFKTMITDKKVLEVKAWGSVKVMSIPLDSITAFRFWPKRDQALVLLLMSGGSQKVLPLPLSANVKTALQKRFEELEYNSPAATALRRLRSQLPETGRGLATETYANTTIVGARGVNSSAENPASVPEKKHFVVFCMDKPGSLDLRMKTRDAHLAFIKEQRGVMLAGPLMRPEDGAMCGSMLIIQGTKKQVENMCAIDPYVEAGLFQSRTVHEWKWVIGTAKQEPASSNENLCVLECWDKPNSIEVRKANRDDHLAYLKQHGDMVVSAGPLLNSEGGMCGSVLIVRGTENDAKVFAENDPYAAAGLFADVKLKRWKRVIDNRE